MSIVKDRPKSNVRKTTFRILEELPIDRPFRSEELRARVITRMLKETGEHRRPHHDTVLRYLRERRHDLGIICLSREESLYIRRM